MRENMNMLVALLASNPSTLLSVPEGTPEEELAKRAARPRKGYCKCGKRISENKRLCLACVCATASDLAMTAKEVG